MSRFEIYCDESRQDLLDNKGSINEINRFTIIGGIWVKSDLREDLKTKIKDLRFRHNTFGEIKWNKVSNSKLAFYQDLINLFFSYDSNIKFHCIVIDASKFNADSFHNSDSELVPCNI